MVRNVVGASGRASLDALVAGETRPERLVARTQGRLKASPATLREALRGHVTAHHRFLLKLHLDQSDALQRAIAAVEAAVGTVLDPFRAHAERLTTIPGVSETVAQAILAAIGVEMTRFPTAAQLSSWAGRCPRSDESAGQRRSTRLRQGGVWIKTILVQAAWAAARTKDTYLHAQFLRLKSRRGPKQAILAVAASILTAVYSMLRDGTAYRDLGGDYFDQQDRSKTIQRLVRRLHDLGCAVEVSVAL